MLLLVNPPPGYVWAPRGYVIRGNRNERRTCDCGAHVPGFHLRPSDLSRIANPSPWVGMKVGQNGRIIENNHYLCALVEAAVAPRSPPPPRPWQEEG